MDVLRAATVKARMAYLASRPDRDHAERWMDYWKEPAHPYPSDEFVRASLALRSEMAAAVTEAAASETPQCSIEVHDGTAPRGTRVWAPRFKAAGELLAAAPSDALLASVLAIVNTPTQVLSLGNEYTNPWGICGVWWRSCSGRGMTDAEFVAHLDETGCEQVIPVERA
jgi:hypothetical protein